MHITSALTGEGFTAELDSRATAFDLKMRVRAEHGVPASMVDILFRNTLLGNADQNYALSAVASWFFIADVVDVDTPRFLAVSYVVKRAACGACGQTAAHSCGRCRASYCSRACQLREWQRRKRIGVALL